MKTIICSLSLYLLTIFMIDSVCEAFINNAIQLRIISISWSGKEWQHTKTDTTCIEVNIGESFGASNGPHYFQLLDIIDSRTIKIKFSDELVVVGEPVEYPSKQNPIIISGEKVCFRTRLHNSGTDYCMNIH